MDQVKINHFCTPLPQDNLSIVQHSFLNDMTDKSKKLYYFIICIVFILTIIILTTFFMFDADCTNTHCSEHSSRAPITSNIFVFSYVDVIHHGVEVSGMDVVCVLHGWTTGTGVELVFILSLASECINFNKAYSMWADAAHGLWHGIVQGCGLLLNRQLSWCALSLVLSNNLCCTASKSLSSLPNLTHVVISSAMYFCLYLC